MKSLRWIPSLSLILCPLFAEAQNAAERGFELGEVLIVGADSAAVPTETVRADVNRARDAGRWDLPETVSTLAEVPMSRSGPRNEPLLFVRGFDGRQVPLFIDGIPVYLPYEGSVDIGRFLMLSVADVSVSHGFRPVTFGPNTLGGAVNVVTRKPTAPRELELLAGAFSGDGLLGSARAGWLGTSVWGQAAAAWRKQEYFRVSEDFEPAGAEDGGRRENSSRRDSLLDAKVGWTPPSGGEYVLGVVRIDSRKDVPPYAGDNPKVQPRYWRYPEWEKNSLYFLGRKPVGLESMIKLRMYADTYANTLKSFDDATYSTQTRPYAFTSYYDDYTVGAGAEWQTRAGPHTPRVSAQYKRDVHREHLEGQLESVYRDWTTSLGIEDALQLGQRWSLVAGLGYDRRENIEAINRSRQPEETFPDNANDAWNPQIGLYYAVTGGVYRATVSRTSRFPTLKDRYSYRRGQAIPNPNLDPEYAMNYELGYAGQIVPGVTTRLAVFLSRVEDVILSVNNVKYDAVTDTWLAQYQNAGKAEHRGAEVGLAWMPAEGWKLGVEYAFLNRKNISHPHLKPTDTPEHRVLAYSDIPLSRRLVLTPDVEFNSDRYSTTDGVRVEGFWLANLRLRAQLQRGWEAVVGVRNLFDKNYELTEGYPEEGRSYYAQVAWRF